MKAAIQHKNGDPTSPDVLSVVDDAAVPEPAAGQVLVKVSCASVNPIDYKLVAGDFPGKKAGPFGCDVRARIRADHGRRRRHRQGLHDAPHQGKACPDRVQAVESETSPLAAPPTSPTPVKDPLRAIGCV